MIQDLCQEGVQWDAPLSDEMLGRWLRWQQELPKLENLKISRCIKPCNFSEVMHYELHHFSDASERAYGAVSYLRAVDLEGQIHCVIRLA